MTGIRWELVATKAYHRFFFSYFLFIYLFVYIYFIWFSFNYFTCLLVYEFVNYLVSIIVFVYLL